MIPSLKELATHTQAAQGVGEAAVLGGYTLGLGFQSVSLRANKRQDDARAVASLENRYSRNGG
jgi:hypothetical protein